MIFLEYLKKDSRSVWLHDTAFIQKDTKVLGFRYGARAPLPDALRINKFHKSRVFKTLGYIELKKDDDDDKGLTLNSLRNMIFLDQLRTDLGELRKTSHAVLQSKEVRCTLPRESKRTCLI
jgi:hypothetical protein